VRVAILDHTRPLSVPVAAIHHQDSRQALGLEDHFGHPGRVALAEAEEIDSFRPGEPSINVVLIGALASLACVFDRSPAIFQMSVLGHGGQPLSRMAQGRPPTELAGSQLGSPLAQRYSLHVMLHRQMG
jgi:hypothetical protein